MKSAEALAELMYHCVARRPCPNDKLIKNICSLTCMDPSETPQAKSLCTMESIDDQGFLSCRTPVSKQKLKVHVLIPGFVYIVLKKMKPWLCSLQ